MKITTRAVFDMTDPAFWDGDMQEACVEEESFEYEGDLALCGRGSDGYGDGSSSSNESSGRSNSNGLGGGGNSGNNDSNNVRSSWGSDAAALARAEQQAGLSHGFSSIGPDNSETSWNWSDGWHNRSTQAVKPSKLGGFMTTSYGWQHPEEAARQYGAAKANQNRQSASLFSDVQSRLGKMGPQFVDRYMDTTGGLKLGDLQSMGIISADEASTLTNSYGGIMDKVGNAVGFSPDTINHPAGSYVEGVDSGLINADGSLTGKGMFSVGAPIAATFGTGPLMGAVYGTTGSLEGTLGAGLGLQAAGATGQGMGMANDFATGAAQAASQVGASGAGQVSYAGNLAELAEASAYGRNGLNGPAAEEIASLESGRRSPATTGGGDAPQPNMFVQAASAQGAQTQGAGPNLFAQFKAAQGGSGSAGSQPSGPGRSGLNMYLS
jgi:hypothetical protein